jgi:hypothetical protein
LAVFIGPPVQHAQEADLALGLAERSAGIDGNIRVQASVAPN